MPIYVAQNAIDKFSEVGRLAVKQELKLRLLADVVSSKNGDVTFSNSESRAIDVINYLQPSLSSEDYDYLCKTNRIRNKIFHCEFDVAVSIMEELTGSQLNGPGVSYIETEGLSAEQLVDRISQGEGTMVSGVSTERAGVFGWLLNAYTRGAFDTALLLFNKSDEIIEKQFDVWS